MRRAIGAAVTSALCCLALSSCSHDASTATPARPSTTSRGSAAPASASPDTSPHPSEPVMPALAKHHSTAGAKAFIRYFVSVLNYAYSIPTSDPLRHVSAEECHVCQTLARGLDSLTKSRGSLAGGRWTVVRVLRIASDRASRPRYLLEINVARGSFKRSDHSKPRLIHPQTVTDQVELRRVPNGWLVRGVETT
jgi:hypothetical protein